jgi:branched-chain amino acid transport system ATP-binding protein
VTTPILSIVGLSKNFGGVKASDHISFEVIKGECHALIGPNGAGKTTLISQLSGLTAPDSGTVHFQGQDITGLPAHKRSVIGIARSFQITTVLLSMSVLDNVALAVQARDGHSFRFWAPARADRSLREPAIAVLGEVGLADRAHELAAALSHGERRQLEIAMALALQADLLLLDEPTAGLGLEETGQMIDMLRRLKNNKTMLLVEHDMDAVFALADRISVLVYGRIIATGTPEEIRADEAVRRAYLGED